VLTTRSTCAACGTRLRDRAGLCGGGTLGVTATGEAVMAQRTEGHIVIAAAV
jgi:hypothetical protein